MATRSCPKRNGYSGNICAFCNYWEGDANLRSRSSSLIEFDDKAKGICLKTRSTWTAGHGACSKFELSPNASRYAK